MSVSLITEARRFARVTLPSVADLVPASSMVDDALLRIRKARATLLTEGAKLEHGELIALSRDIRDACDELEQVRRLLLHDPTEDQ
jgi:hypothetical protein